MVGELDRVADQVGQDLPQSQRIADHLPLKGGIYAHAQFQAFLPRRVAEERYHRRGALLESELFFSKVQFARIDFRQVENVVEQDAQRAAAGSDRFGIFALPIRQRGFHQEARHADHTVHRCADLVAHGGEELAFGLRCAFGVRLRLLQILDVLSPGRFELGGVAFVHSLLEPEKGGEGHQIEEDQESSRPLKLRRYKTHRVE